MRKYAAIPILDAARRCGVVINDRTLGRTEVEAKCPFCGDKARRYHLRMNTVKDVYMCWLCGTSGNSVSLYARLKNISYRDAADDLQGGSNLYQMPQTPVPKTQPEREPRPLPERHAVFHAMLEHLALNEKHRENLLGRGLSKDRIEQNEYRSLPESHKARLLLAGMLSVFHDLDGIPGFFQNGAGRWNIAGAPGLMIPCRDRYGLIQGMQVRLDDEAAQERRYRWLSSGHEITGVRSGAYIHITGNLTAAVAYITEGPLKGDAASFHDGDALFVCVPGVNVTDGLRESVDTLSAKDYIIAMDMDKMTNWRVREACKKIAKELSAIDGARVHTANWDPRYKGVDDYYLAQNRAGQNKPLLLEAA